MAQTAPKLTTSKCLLWWRCPLWVSFCCSQGIPISRDSSVEVWDAPQSQTQPILYWLTDCPFKNGSHFSSIRLSRYFLVKQPTYDTNAVVSKTSPGKVFSCSLKFATDSAQRTFSEAKPPTNRLASSIVIAVCSASCWHFNFSAVALKQITYLTLILIKCPWVFKQIKSHKVKVCLFEICKRCWKTMLYSKEVDTEHTNPLHRALVVRLISLHRKYPLIAETRGSLSTIYSRLNQKTCHSPVDKYITWDDGRMSRVKTLLSFMAPFSQGREEIQPSQLRRFGHVV